MTYEKIVTLYDTAEHAEAARRSLEAAGFSPSEISMINSKTLALAGDKLREPGLWHRLFGRDIQQYEATVYGRSVEAGGVVLTVRVPERSPGYRSDQTRRTGGADCDSSPGRRETYARGAPSPGHRRSGRRGIRRRSARSGRGANQRRQAPGPGGDHSNPPFRNGNSRGSTSDIA
jgi:hypothetical protein